MNKTFKLVFSKARNTLMVVNEATKSTQTKGCRTVIAAAVLSAMISGSAFALTTQGDGAAAISFDGEQLVKVEGSQATLDVTYADGVITVENLSGWTTPEGKTGQGALTNLTFNGSDFVSSTAMNIQGGTEGGVIFSNSSNNRGGGVTVWQADGKPQLKHQISGITFEKNKAQAGGGAIAFEPWGSMDARTQAELTNNKFIENDSQAEGGAAFLENAEVSIVDSTFEKNTAGSRGGAIYGDGNSSIKVTNSHFVQNSANTTGGAISLWSDNDKGGQYFKVSDSTFETNTAGTKGGAIAWLQMESQESGEQQLDIENSFFTGNSATTGGAIYADYDFKVSSSEFKDNKSSEHGGAIFAKRSFEITEATFKHNQSTKDGGAIAFDNYGFKGTNGYQGWKEEDGVSRAITKSEFVINEAANGGAVAVKVERDFYAVPTMFDEVTFTDNSATGKGGAILAEDDITVKNSTFGGNSADKGGALFVDLAANVTLQDVVFTSNKAEASGGAIFVETGSSVTFTGDATFVANTVGGVLNDIHNDGHVVVNAGTLTLDGGITGNGTLTFADGSSLNVKLGSSQTDSTTISNAISVGENVGLSMTFNPGYVGEYQLLGEGGSLDGEFVVTENTVYNITAVEDEAGTYSIELKSAGEIAQSTGADSNQASALNAVMSDSSSHEIFNQIATAISDGIQSTDPVVRQAALDAVTAMSPEVAPMVTQVQSDTATQVFGLIGNRLGGSAQGMASGDGTSGTALWVQGMVGTMDLDDTSKARGYSADTTGMAMGLEAKPTDAFTVGAGFAYADTEVDGFLRKTDVESMTAFLYGEYKPSNWFVNGIVSYAWANYEEAKSVAGIGVDAEYDADTFGVQLMTGLDLAVANFSVTPEVGLRYFHIGTDAYTDTAGTSVGDSDEDVLTGVLGARLSTAIEMSKAVRFVPEARVAMTYDFVDADNSSFVTLANGSSYSVEGETLDRFGVEAGVGVKAEMGDNFEMSLSYEGAWRGDYENHAGILNAKYKF